VGGPGRATGMEGLRLNGALGALLGRTDWFQGGRKRNGRGGWATKKMRTKTANCDWRRPMQGGGKANRNLDENSERDDVVFGGKPCGRV